MKKTSRRGGRQLLWVLAASVVLAGCGAGRNIDAGAALHDVYKKIEAGPAWAGSEDLVAAHASLSNSPAVNAACTPMYSGRPRRLVRFLCIIQNAQTFLLLGFSVSPDGSSVAPIAPRLILSFERATIRWFSEATGRPSLFSSPTQAQFKAQPGVPGRECADSPLTTIAKGASCAVGAELNDTVLLGRTPRPYFDPTPWQERLQITSPVSGRVFNFVCRNPPKLLVARCDATNGAVIYLGSVKPQFAPR
jgi:hypothetical protein